MKYAIVSVKGKQYKVEEGKEFLVNKLSEGEKIDAKVLLTVDGEKVEIGQPEVKSAKMDMEVIGEEKGEKIKVFKYKSKSKYRRMTGSRAKFTRVLVNKI